MKLAASLGSDHAVEMLITVYGDKYPQVPKDSEQHMFYLAKSAQRGCWRGTQGLMKYYLDQETADPTQKEGGSTWKRESRCCFKIRTADPTVRHVTPPESLSSDAADV